MYTKILGIGSYLPLKIRTNADLEKMIDTSDEWIVIRTGIRERRIASFNDTVVTMGFHASESALKMAGVQKKDIGLIIVGTTTSSYAFPSTACLIQKMLGIKICAAFDLSAACSGFIYALSIADQYIKNNIVKYALVIGVDVLSKTLNPKDRSTLILFGDGAGAVLLGSNKKPGILSTHLYANGNYSHLLTLPFKDRQNNKKSAFITMKGNEVFKIAITELSKIVINTLQVNNIKCSSLDWLIPHQANLRIINAIAKKIGISMKKVILTLDRYGNISSASIPVALDEAVRDGRINSGNLILLEAFGGGFTWGSALVRF
ncbi:3-oxoacyl-[acyl-carrier-protein] synthase 3 [Serratia symbiotica]|nr:3-oxoacyl-[acyl-carrier-protein] synthase 3 [Serratia symbiotica]